LVPPYSCLIAFFISAHTSAELGGAFITEDNLDPEIAGYACPFYPFLLGGTTDIDPDCSLNWRTKHRTADGANISITTEAPQTQRFAHEAETAIQ
jgi:hypothetical protein